MCSNKLKILVSIALFLIIMKRDEEDLVTEKENEQIF